jgi:hypothetical protein
MSVRLSEVDDNLESVKAAAPFMYDTIVVGIEAVISRCQCFDIPHFCYRGVYSNFHMITNLLRTLGQ